jgi:hypothetical protein
VRQVEIADEHGESVIVEVHSPVGSGDEMLSGEYTKSSRPASAEEEAYEDEY